MFEGISAHTYMGGVHVSWNEVRELSRCALMKLGFVVGRGEEKEKDVQSFVIAFGKFCPHLE